MAPGIDPGGATMTDVDSVRVLAEEHDLDYIDIDRYSVDLRAASLVPIEVAKHTQAVPIGRRFGTPIIAVADPANTAIARSLTKLRQGAIPMKALLAHPDCYEVRPLARLRLIIEQADGGWIVRSVGDHDPVLRHP
jgi:hypothetical protein